MGEVQKCSLSFPPTRWAQRKDRIFLTIEVEDCKKPDIKLEVQKLHFRSKGGHEHKTYGLDLEFFKEVVPEKSKQHVTAREITFSIEKKEEGPYWPRLLKEGKPSYLKTDFNKWRDEDDSEEDDEGIGDNFEDMMNQMGAAGGQGFDPGDVPDDGDSDDEELPDLEG